MSDALDWIRPGAQGIFVGAALDTETSGLDPARDHIIEVGIQLFHFELPSGKITEMLDSFSGLQDPGFPITLQIQGVTGITPSMLTGQSIDWQRVDGVLAGADLILAHNATFDRGFMDRKSRVSASKVWVCTQTGIDWRAKGFQNAKLQGICAALGIVFNAHRAMSDVSAMLQMVQAKDTFSGAPFLAEILASGREDVHSIWVEGDTYEKREILKANGFRWNAASKAWTKQVVGPGHVDQVEFLRAILPGMQIQSRSVAPQERFKPL